MLNNLIDQVKLKILARKRLARIQTKVDPLFSLSEKMFNVLNTSLDNDLDRMRVISTMNNLMKHQIDINMQIKEKNT